MTLQVDVSDDITKSGSPWGSPNPSLHPFGHCHQTWFSGELIPIWHLDLDNAGKTLGVAIIFATNSVTVYRVQNYSSIIARMNCSNESDVLLRLVKCRWSVGRVRTACRYFGIALSRLGSTSTALDTLRHAWPPIDPMTCCYPTDVVQLMLCSAGLYGNRAIVYCSQDNSESRLANPV